MFNLNLTPLHKPTAVGKALPYIGKVFMTKQFSDQVVRNPHMDYYIKAIRNMVNKSNRKIVWAGSDPRDMENWTRLINSAVPLKGISDQKLENLFTKKSKYFIPQMSVLTNDLTDGYNGLYGVMGDVMDQGAIVMGRPGGMHAPAAMLHELGHNLFHEKHPVIARLSYGNKYPIREQQALGGQNWIANMASLTGQKVGRLIDEAFATGYGYKALKEIGAPSAVRRQYLKTTLPAYLTYTKLFVPKENPYKLANW